MEGESARSADEKRVSGPAAVLLLLLLQGELVSLSHIRVAPAGFGGQGPQGATHQARADQGSDRPRLGDSHADLKKKIKKHR